MSKDLLAKFLPFSVPKKKNFTVFRRNFGKKFSLSCPVTAETEQGCVKLVHPPQEAAAPRTRVCARSCKIQATISATLRKISFIEAVAKTIEAVAKKKKKKRERDPTGLESRAERQVPIGSLFQHREDSKLDCN